MVLKNLKIVLEDRIINKGTLIFENGIITHIKEGEYFGDALDCNGLIAMPGFIDIHIHGSAGSNPHKTKHPELSPHSD